MLTKQELRIILTRKLLPSDDRENKSPELPRLSDGKLSAQPGSGS